MNTNRIPETKAMNVAYHHYLIAKAKECRKVGYMEEARSALNDAARTRILIKYFIPDNNMPF